MDVSNFGLLEESFRKLSLRSSAPTFSSFRWICPHSPMISPSNFIENKFSIYQLNFQLNMNGKKSLVEGVKCCFSWSSLKCWTKGNWFLWKRKSRWTSIYRQTRGEVSYNLGFPLDGFIFHNLFLAILKTTRVSEFGIKRAANEVLTFCATSSCYSNTKL